MIVLRNRDHRLKVILAEHVQTLINVLDLLVIHDSGLDWPSQLLLIAHPDEIGVPSRLLLLLLLPHPLLVDGLGFLSLLLCFKLLSLGFELLLSTVS